jgi:hypothetical protein
VSALNDNQRNSGIHIASAWPELVALRTEVMEGSPERNERGRRVTSRHHETTVQSRQHQIEMWLADVFFLHDRAASSFSNEMVVFVIKAT